MEGKIDLPDGRLVELSDGKLNRFAIWKIK